MPHTIELVDGIVEQGQKAIVFTSFEASVNALHDHFGASAVVITGATPATLRQELADRFQLDPDVKVFLANLVAGGVGLNLTAATHVVFNDLDWVPANHWQAEDRAYRIGQDRTVNVSYLVAAGTVDDWKRLEIEAGVPTVYPQTQDHFVAQMCNLDALGGVSFDKGCYTGQEVIARVHYRGAVKRHMQVRRLDQPAPAPGTKVDGGEVVDAAPLSGGGSIALVVGTPG